MKKRQLLLTSLLIAMLALSVCLFSACHLFDNSQNNPPIGENEKKQYTISFASGADDAVGNAPVAIVAQEGSDVKLPSCPFTRENFNFKGWSDGSKVYSAGANYTVGSENVVLTAVWEAIVLDAPAASELPDSFYDASNWGYMTNNDGQSNDGGDIPYSMVDGSIKFHKANQAYELGDVSNATVSFMLKGTNDWSIWFNSSTKDNHNNSSYRLAYAYGGIRLVLSSAPEQAAAVVTDNLYKKGEWNRFDVVFSTVDGVCEIKLYINGARATLAAGDNTTPQVSVSDNVLTHTQPAMFKTGTYAVVKVWEAHNYVQIKPVAKADEEDLPIIACIGASITEGAGAGNFYTESYPAQLQNALAGAYNVINFGNSGKTVRTDLGDDVAWLKQYQWQGVQAIVPDIAILNIGTNDSKTTNDPLSTYESFYEAYDYLIDQLLAVNPDMQIIVCTVPYAFSDIWGINNDNIANIIAPVQRDIASENGYTLIDLYEYSQGKGHLFPDGVHPNTKGYEMFVKIIKKALLEGGEALTEEFIAEINEEYMPKVPNAFVEVGSVVIDNMTLTITGTSNDDGLQLFVGQQPGDDTVYNSYNSITPADDGSFEIAFDLTTMPIGGWYNVRLYFTDGNYYTVSLNETKNGAGENLALWSWVILENTQVQICSWDEGSIPTLSFKVEEYVKPSFETTITEGSVAEENGQIILTVKGTTTDKNLVLVVGPQDDITLYGHAVDVADDGSFTVSCDLTTLEVSTSWQNAQLFMSDGKSIVVPYDVVGLNVDDELYSSQAKKKIVVKTWGGDKILSLSVEYYDDTYSLTATEIKYENGKLVFSGVSTNVRTLTAYLYNTDEGIKDYCADAALASDGSFTVEIGLEQLTMAAGNWYYLWTSVNGGDLTKVIYESYNSSEEYMYGFRTYKWAYWEGIAVNYSNTGYKNSITNYGIEEIDGKPVFVLEGYIDDLTVAADTITLRLDKTGGTKEQLDVVNLATEAGHFKFEYDLSNIIISEDSTQYKEKAYFVRIFVNGSKHSDVNSKWAKNDLFVPVNVAGNDYYLMRNNASAYYTLGIVKLENAQPIPSVSYTGAVLENGKLVLSGT
ncbi:MAG: hypothetical protein IJX97_06310 [Clostridia bacterium]|nr:hypothetical protein [Clostridia bacterium]